MNFKCSSKIIGMILTDLLFCCIVHAADNSELVVCYVDRTCSGGGGKAMTIRQCCVASDGLAFQVISEEEPASCMNCIGMCMNIMYRAHNNNN